MAQIMDSLCFCMRNRRRSKFHICFWILTEHSVYIYYFIDEQKHHIYICVGVCAGKWILWAIIIYNNFTIESQIHILINLFS